MTVHECDNYYRPSVSTIVNVIMCQRTFVHSDTRWDVVKDKEDMFSTALKSARVRFWAALPKDDKVPPTSRLPICFSNQTVPWSGHRAIFERFCGDNKRFHTSERLAARPTGKFPRDRDTTK